MKPAMFALLILFCVVVQALPEEEKLRACTELSRSVLPGQRELAKARCLEFASNECDRIERSLNETCVEGSHSENAIKYDMARGTSGACEAAMIKRKTQKIFCDGLVKECQESNVAMGSGGAQATCKTFRNEDDKKLCAEVDRHAARVSAMENQEKKKCTL